MKLARQALLVAGVVSVTLSAQAPVVLPAQATPDACAQVWDGNLAAFEDFLRTGRVTDVRTVPVGVTRPSRAFFAPGGIAESMAWKPIRPGVQNGYFESYRSEIAAYELDKLLDLRMVPPTVERRIGDQVGAAVLWASPTKSFKDLGGVTGQGGIPGPPAVRVATWTRQLVRAKMFDNLIANLDPNLGNWLVDPDWHLLLIDHSRAFTTKRTMPHRLDKVDRPLWDRFLALDEAALLGAIGDWVGRSELRALLDRRDRMRQDVERLVATRGQSVFLQ